MKKIKPIIILGFVLCCASTFVFARSNQPNPPDSDQSATPLSPIVDPIEYQSCYVVSINSDWAVFEPHWESQSHVVFTLKHSDPNSQPLVFTDDQGVDNQWARLSTNSNLLAVAQSVEARGKITVILLSDNRVVFSYYTPTAPYVYHFESDLLVAHYFDPGELEVKWLFLDPLSGRNQPPNFQSISQSEMIVPDFVQQILQEKTPWCLSWPSFN